MKNSEFDPKTAIMLHPTLAKPEDNRFVNIDKATDEEFYTKHPIVRSGDTMRQGRGVGYTVPTMFPSSPARPVVNEPIQETPGVKGCMIL